MDENRFLILRVSQRYAPFKWILILFINRNNNMKIQTVILSNNLFLFGWDFSEVVITLVFIPLGWIVGIKEWCITAQWQSNREGVPASVL
jgi:hypothetical protein